MGHSWYDASSNAPAGAGSHFYSLGVHADGAVVAWAADGNGQGTTIAPTASASAFAAVYGRRSNSQPDGEGTVPSALTNVVAVAAGYFDGLPTATGAVVAGSDSAAAGNGGAAGIKAKTLAIAPQPTTTTVAASAASSVYGQSVTFTATVTSGGNPLDVGTVDFEEGSTILASAVPLNAAGMASFTIDTLSAGGSPHTITADFNGPSSYLGSSGGTSLTVTPAPLTVTADNQTKVYGAAVPALTAHYAGFVLGQGPAYLGGSLILVTSATQASDVIGFYPIIPLGLTSTNYAIQFVRGNLDVTPAPLSVTADDQTKVYGDGPAHVHGPLHRLRSG